MKQRVTIFRKFSELPKARTCLYLNLFLGSAFKRSHSGIIGAGKEGMTWDHQNEFFILTSFLLALVWYLGVGLLVLRAYPGSSLKDHSCQGSEVLGIKVGFG